MIAFALHQKMGSFLPLLPNGLPNNGAAFPTLVAKLLPAGVKGLIVCGILAALMSSLASLFNSSSALFTIDFYQRFKPNTPPKKLVAIGGGNCNNRDSRHPLDSRNAFCGRRSIPLPARRAVSARSGHRDRLPYGYCLEAHICTRRHVGTYLRPYHRLHTPRRENLLQQR